MLLSAQQLHSASYHCQGFLFWVEGVLPHSANILSYFQHFPANSFSILHIYFLPAFKFASFDSAIPCARIETLARAGRSCVLCQILTFIIFSCQKTSLFEGMDGGVILYFLEPVETRYTATCSLVSQASRKAIDTLKYLSN
jgi:hypothetical protein